MHGAIQSAAPGACDVGRRARSGVPPPDSIGCRARVRVRRGPDRRSGVLNHGQPSFERDFHAATEQFECLRRLLTSKVGYEAFTNVEGVRAKLGKRIIQALKMNDDGADTVAGAQARPRLVLTDVNISRAGARARGRGRRRTLCLHRRARLSHAAHAQLLRPCAGAAEQALAAHVQALPGQVRGGHSHAFCPRFPPPPPPRPTERSRY